MKQTAVEWLFEQIVNRTDRMYFLKEFEQAKEMEKQQIIDALCVGNDVGLLYNSSVYAEEWDALVKKNKEKETLEEAAENHLQKWRLLNNIHLSNILHAERCKNDFIAGAKWQMNKQNNFTIGFSEWSIAKVLGCNTFTLNQDELNIYKKYIDTLNGN